MTKTTENGRALETLARAIATLALLGALGGCGEKNTGSESSASQTEATAATVSRYDSGPRAAGEADEDLAEKGKQVFQLKGCSACHTFGKRSTGPDLAGVTLRRTAQWMEQQILHPEMMAKEDPISRKLFAEFALQMPNQGLTPDEAKAVIEYFKHLDHEANEKD